MTVHQFNLATIRRTIKKASSCVYTNHTLFMFYKNELFCVIFIGIVLVFTALGAFIVIYEGIMLIYGWLMEKIPLKQIMDE